MGSPLNQTLIGDPTDFTFGTCEVSDGHGEVLSASLKDTNDMQKWTNCSGNTKLVLLKDQRFEFVLEVEFASSIGSPEQGDSIVLPTGQTAQVINTELKWDQNQRKRMTINATHWKSIGSSPVVTALTS